MAYKKNLVVSIKCNGKILREKDEFVKIPFNSEYSILLKNLHSRKALLNIDIDGMSVFKDLVINSNQTVELERYMNKPNKFKFIEKTAAISDHRGDHIDDGFIRVEFQFEKELPVYHEEYVTYRRYDYTPYPNNLFWRTSIGDNISYGANNLYCCSPFVKEQDRSFSITKSQMDSIKDAVNDNGITTAGSHSNQMFVEAHIGSLEPNKEIIIIRMKGTHHGMPVQTAVTVNDKITCPMCGKQNNSNNRYCPGCGTYLD